MQEQPTGQKLLDLTTFLLPKSLKQKHNCFSVEMARRHGGLLGMCVRVHVSRSKLEIPLTFSDTTSLQQKKFLKLANSFLSKLRQCHSYSTRHKDVEKKDVGFKK